MLSQFKTLSLSMIFLLTEITLVEGKPYVKLILINGE